MPLKIIILLLILAIPIVPTFWAIRDIPNRCFASSRSKVIWFVVVATFPFIGAMFYIIIGRRYTRPAEPILEQGIKTG
ncbi:MAG: PLD nuclease N-terminal domain-containing protein [Syntrophobacteraceae bacterium]